MTIDQVLYGARILLRAAGPVLATLGVTQGEMIVAIGGVLLSAAGEVWGIIKMRAVKAQAPAVPPIMDEIERRARQLAAEMRASGQ
jgi:hypothetical protein